MRSSYCEGNTLQLVKDSCYTPIAMVIVPVLLKASSLTGLGLAVDLSVVSQAVMDVVCTRDRQPGVYVGVDGCGVYVGSGWVWCVRGA